MSSRNLLFIEGDLDAELRARQQKITQAVDSVPKEQFLISSDQELIDHIAASFTIAPLVLFEDAKTMAQQETQVDISKDPMRFFFHDENRGPVYIPGTEVVITIPFTGEPWLFRCRTSTWSTVFPSAELESNTLRLRIARPHDADPSSFKTAYEGEVKSIREYVERSHAQVTTYNQNLSNLITPAINARRNRLGRHNNIAALLDIPLVTKPGAPTIEPVKVQIRRPPALPVAPKTGLVPEPGITDENYEHILSFIRHQGRTFERTPHTYAVHGEEELRDIILAQLNGHFRGEAVGEVFRGKGKTDICIEQDNRAAFIGECKLWTGPAALTPALDQLLSYLTWRDSKASLVVFNVKNKDFTKILEVIPATLHAHPLFIRSLPCAEAGEWRVEMRSAEDAGRRVIVQVFAFNIFNSVAPSIRATG